MAMIEIKAEPSATELRVFAALWLVFWVVVGRITVAAGDGFLVAAVVTGGFFGLSLLLNRDVKGAERLWGLGFPLGLFALWGIGRAVAPGADESATLGPRLLWLACGLVGVAGAALVLASRRRGIAWYRAWMLAAMPIGWVLSHAMMVAVFYGVVTPVGLLMRMMGRDPMTREFDQAAATYWVEHQQPGDQKRYFKQS